MTPLNQLNITQAHQGLKNKEFSAVELTAAVLKQIKDKDKSIRSFLTITGDLALKQAEKTDEKIKNKQEIGILEGVPMAVKDNILVKDVKCTAGSKILENYIAPYNAAVIQRLKKAGAVIVGKTNLDEFAMGSSTENSAFQITRNPYDLERVPGGSSGGSAAAAADNQCIFALGSDTGGSIRQPASFCGVVGLKPTYGRVSRYGLMAMASSLDQIGPLTKTVEDAKIVLEVISGKDDLDSTSAVVLKERSGRKISWTYGLSRDSSPSAQNNKLSNLKIGLPKEYFIKGLDPEVEKIIKKSISKFEEMGAKIIEVSLPQTEYALAAYYIIMPAEASTNLARYDGIKYGNSAAASNLLDVYLKTRQHYFGDEPRRRIMLGAYILSAGYYETYYLKAQKVRTKIKQDFENVFKKADVLMTPTSPTPAFKIGEKTDDPLKMYLSDIYTVPINLAGLPAVSLPCGQIGNLPVGLQIIGKHFEEEKILDIAQLYELSRK